MTEAIDGTPPPRVITDWRDWMNEFPKVAALSLLAVAGWMLAGLGFLVTEVVVWVALARGHAVVVDASQFALIDRYTDGLIWLTPFAVAAIVGKRATEKPEVIRAEGEAKAAVALAAQTGIYPVPVTPVTASETPVSLDHRDSERGDL